MSQQRIRDRQQQSPPKIEHGNTSISDSVASQVAGIVAQEVEGVHMGGGTSRAVGGCIDSMTGGSGNTT